MKQSDTAYFRLHQQDCPETYIDGDIMARELPRVEVEPVVRHLNLVTIDDLLLENTVSVTQTISPSRVVQGRKAVEKTSSKPPETTVTQSSIMLLLNDVLDAETELINPSYNILSVQIVKIRPCLGQTHPWQHPSSRHSAWRCPKLDP